MARQVRLLLRPDLSTSSPQRAWQLRWKAGRRPGADEVDADDVLGAIPYRLVADNERLTQDVGISIVRFAPIEHHCSDAVWVEDGADWARTVAIPYACRHADVFASRLYVESCD